MLPFLKRGDAVDAELDNLCPSSCWARQTPARLGYNGVDGDPGVIPVGFLWDGTNHAAEPATLQKCDGAGPAVGSSNASCSG